MRTEVQLLMTPGPVAVPDFVFEAIGKPVVHHRSIAFREMFAELQLALKYFFQASGPVLAMAGTGTFGMEAAMASLFRQGEKVLIPAFGKFSDRWVEQGERLGLEVLELKNEWGEVARAEELLELVDRYPDLKGLVLTHCETSTGAMLDLEEIALEVRRIRPDILIVVDAISSVGVVPFYFDAWGLDVAVSASQKSMMNPAGTVFAALSERATSMMEAGTGSMQYGTYLRALQDGWYPFTAPTQLFYGLGAALRRVVEVSLPEVWSKAHLLSGLVKRGLPVLGGELVGAANADSLTVFKIPGIDPNRLKGLLEKKYKIVLGGGQGIFAGKVLRVSHFGDFGLEETLQFLHALEMSINELKSE